MGRCNPKTNTCTRTPWWREAMGINWYGQGGGVPAQATGLSITANTDSAQTLEVTGGSHGILLQKKWAAVDDVPVDGETYLVNDVIGVNNVVVFVGDVQEINLSSLDWGTPYYYQWFEFSGTTYNTTNGPTANDTTLPDMSALSNLELWLDSSGLVVNTNNSYGQVDASGNIVSWKSLTPGPTGRDFTVQGTAPTLSGGAVNFGGAGNLRGTTTTGWADFMSYNATLANLKYTFHAVFRAGTGSNPGATYGIMGNNGASFSNKGVAFYFNDSSLNNGIVGLLSATNLQILNTRRTDICTPNELHLLTIIRRFDFTLNAFRDIWFVDGLLIGVNVVSLSTNVMTTPTFELEVGALGNAGIRMIGDIKEIILQSGIEDGDIMERVIAGLLEKHSISKQSTLAQVDTTRTSTIYETVSTLEKYYLSATIDQSPIKKNKVIKYFAEGDRHTPNDARKIVKMLSDDYGLTTSAQADVIDPVGSLFIGDIAGGFASSGRHFIFNSQHTNDGGASAPPHSIFVRYSDDDGETYTEVDLTSLFPSDSMSHFRMHGNMIDNNGVFMVCGYRLNTGATLSARYILRCTNGDGSNLSDWTYIEVEQSANYINESTMIGLSGSVVMIISRNEVTGEFTKYRSTDNGLTWINDGDLNFGFSFVSPKPCRLSKFKIESSDVIACWYTDNSAARAYVTYALASNLIIDTSDWDTTNHIVLNTGRLPHYLGVIHPMNNFEAIMLTPYEQSVYDPEDNDIVTLTCLSTHYATVKTALGI